MALWLGGRFRLDERVIAGGHLLWKATDELLCRPVTIRLLPRGVRVPPRVMAAVQAAARIGDPRLAAIYDTDYDIEGPYIVSEWTPGTHLEDLVLSGLPSPALAAAMIADAADALAVAHRAGLPHLCLTPRSLRWDTGSGLKISGLGIDAALAGVRAADPAAASAADTQALGRMLYALLTGYWPGEEPTALPAAALPAALPTALPTALPAAPRHHGQVYSPRQVRAGVPGVLDAITCHTLQLSSAPGAGLSAGLSPGLSPGLSAGLSPAGLAVALRATYSPSRSGVPAAEVVSRPRAARHARVRHHTSLLRPAA